jgi:uncharacterized protein YdgA (DUF945 family)
MTFGNEQQLVAIDGVTFDGKQERTSYGFNVGSFDMDMGTMTATAEGMPISGIEGITLKASSSLDGDIVSAAMRMEMSGQKIPNFGDVSVIADMNLARLDAEAMGALSKRLKGLSSSQDPNKLLLEAEAEFKQLFAAGFTVSVNQLDVGLPMGTVESKMSFDFPAGDGANFVWTSLLLNTVAKIDLRVPEALVQLATSMNPQAGAIVGMGYLKKEGDVYVMDAEYKKGLLTVNGAPIPIPMGAFQ